MNELANSTRVKRGFHRVGLALSIVLGALALVAGAIFSWDSSGSQREQFLARQCVVNAMNKYKPNPDNIYAEDVLNLDLRRDCHSSEPSDKGLEEMKQLVNSGFSYTATLASYLGVTALITALVGLLAYYSVAAFSWIVRGFMRG